ncbi:hypothetical protein JTE90_000378 [Oedothorax gibbosus]|uniref:Uncharacterized protein n=1 Tax=Oedothorax gibbosus TaxID=931172 RepID=A0AAV6TRE8_9ARAC|nr:hypothetical protein JTE90_000378 [Oedothorax gibbosus]
MSDVLFPSLDSRDMSSTAVDEETLASAEWDVSIPSYCRFNFYNRKSIEVCIPMAEDQFDLFWLELIHRRYAGTHLWISGTWSGRWSWTREPVETSMLIELEKDCVLQASQFDVDGMMKAHDGDLGRVVRTQLDFGKRYLFELGKKSMSYGRRIVTGTTTTKIVTSEDGLEDPWWGLPYPFECVRDDKCSPSQKIIWFAKPDSMETVSRWNGNALISPGPRVSEMANYLLDMFVECGSNIDFAGMYCPIL